MLMPSRDLESHAYAAGFHCVVGIDEAGRGPLAGPVVAAACHLPLHIDLPGINDSKKLSATQRNALFHQLTSHPEVHYGIGIVPSDIIDQINIYQATILAMQQAAQALTCSFDYLLVDGMALPYPHATVQKVIGGDATSCCIAAASILAKETRDQIMCQHALTWPCYGFDKHKGYGTKQHLAALAEHGPCALHRRSFAPIKYALS